MRIRTIFQLSFFLSLIFIFATTAPLFAVDGYVMVGDNQTLINNGTIAGDPGDDGVSSADDNQTIINYGTILGDTGINFCTGDTGAAGDDTITNYGTITTTDGTAIRMGEGDDTFTNNSTGIINGEVIMGPGNDTLDNPGNINGKVKMGEGDDTLINNGTINHGDGCCGAIIMSDGEDTAINNGIVNGKVKLAGGDDIFTNYGTINGLCDGMGCSTAISLGCGDDVLNLMSGSVVNGDIDGCDEDDEINLDGEGTFDHDIDDFEYLNKTGAGTWTLNGDVEVDDTATVAAGTLLVNGTMGDGGLDVTVDPGATLGGVCTIDGDLTNNGTVSPGASIGIMTITGDYTHNAGATLLVEIEGTDNISLLDNSDQLDVSDTATLNGGRVEVTPVGYVTEGSVYTVVTAGDLAGAGFDGVNSTAVLSFELNTVGSDVQLVVADRKSYADALAGGRPNQQAIGNILQGIVPTATGDMRELFNALDGLPDANALGNALNQLSPEVYAGLTDVSLGGVNLYNGTMLNRLGQLRGTGQVASGQSGQRYADNWNTMTDSGPVLANVPAPSRNTDGWSTWARGFSVFADHESTSKQLGFDYNTVGMAAGMDNTLNENLALGFSLGAARTDVNYSGVNSDTDVDTRHLGVYGTYSTDKYYIDASLSYALNSYDTDRSIVIGAVTKQATSDHDADDYSVYVGGGCFHKLGDWGLVPTMSLQYAYHDEEGFSEKGAGGLNLKVSSFDADSFISRLGFRLGRMFEAGYMKIFPEVSIQWAHEFGDTDRQVIARFAGNPAGSFTVNGAEPNRDSALVGVGITAYAEENITLYFNYDAELRSDFNAHCFSLGFRLDF